MESSIRKYQSYLTISGTAVILFSVWSFFRFAVYLYTHPSLVMEWVAWEPENDLQLRVMLMITGIVVFLFSSLIILVNICIGRGAIREGRGGKGGRLYPILSALYLVFSLGSAVPDLTAVNGLSGQIMLSTGLIVDVSCTFAHGNLLYSVFRLRRLLRKMR